MDKKDLINCSPVRYFEKVSPALKTGEIGLITAKKGLGKTSVLVQFGLDTLLSDKGLIHVSFDQHSSNVITWYDSVLSEITKKRNINANDISDINDEIIRNRTILNFNQESFTLPKVVSTIKAMKEGGINISSIVVDGLDVGNTSAEDLKCFADFVKATEMTSWFSYASEAATLKETLPKDKLAFFATVTHLASDGKGLNLYILKNGEGQVPLNSKTMLMSK